MKSGTINQTKPNRTEPQRTETNWGPMASLTPPRVAPNRPIVPLPEYSPLSSPSSHCFPLPCSLAPLLWPRPAVSTIHARAAHFRLCSITACVRLYVCACMCVFGVWNEATAVGKCFINNNKTVIKWNYNKTRNTQQHLMRFPNRGEQLSSL